MSSNSSILNSRKPFITRPRTRMRNSCNGINNGNNKYLNKSLPNKQNGRSRSISSCSKQTASVEELESIREKLFQLHENESANNNENNNSNNNQESSITKGLADYSTEDLQKVFPYLREYAHRKGYEEDYDNAQISFSLSEIVLNELKCRATNQDASSDATAATTSSQSEFESKWQKIFETYDEETAKKRKELEKTHETQLENFEKLWSDEMPRKYRKPSQRLLQIKKVEKSLSLSCDYERAKAVHREYEDLAAHELSEAQKNLDRDYESARAKLVSKQQKEIQSFDDTRFHLLMVKKSKYEDLKAAFENRSKVVQSKMETQRSAKKSIEQFGASFQFTTVENDGAKGEERDFILLPELTPPNDPQYVEEDKKRKRELNKKKLAYQKQNAELTLARYTVDGQEFASKEEDDKNAQKNEAKENVKNEKIADQNQKTQSEAENIAENQQDEQNGGENEKTQVAVQVEGENQNQGTNPPKEEEATEEGNSGNAENPPSSNDESKLSSVLHAADSLLS